MSQDHSYFAARAVEERRLAMTASDPSVRRVHLDLAARYALQAGPKADLIHNPEDVRRSA